MIVVLIIALLAAFALPEYSEQIRKARRSDAVDALLDCAAAQTRHYTTASPPSYLTQAQADTPAISVCNMGVSKEGHYNIAITNPNCSSNGGSVNWCFLLTATPVGGQALDTQCSTCLLYTS